MQIMPHDKSRRLTEAKILRWADAHHRRTGEWPEPVPSHVIEAPSERWDSLNQALQKGFRSLQGGTTLRKILAQRRGRKYRIKCPHITEAQIINWAKAHHRQAGKWPVRHSGPILDGYPGDTWHKIDTALRNGCRGLPGDSSLSQLLKRCCGVRPKYEVPPLTIQQVCAWAQSHYRRTGRWPAAQAGPIADADHEVTWMAVHNALVQGHRGLPGGLTLPKLLRRELGARPIFQPLRLDERRIRLWAGEHRYRAGAWPAKYSGPVFGVKDMTWATVDSALRRGHYGLPGGSSLTELRRTWRARRN